MNLPQASIEAELELGVLGARLQGVAAARAVAHAQCAARRVAAGASVAPGRGRPPWPVKTLDTVAVEADGPLREPAVTVVLKGPHVPEVHARATLDVARGFEMREPRAVLTRGGARVVARADRIRAGGGAVDVTGIDVESAGEPLRGEAHVVPQLLWMRLSTAGMNLNPVLRLAGASPVTMGHVSVDVDVRADRAGARRSPERRLRRRRPRVETHQRACRAQRSADGESMGTPSRPRVI